MFAMDGASVCAHDGRKRINGGCASGRRFWSGEYKCLAYDRGYMADARVVGYILTESLGCIELKTTELMGKETGKRRSMDCVIA